MLSSPRDAADVLGQRAHVGVVAHGHRAVAAEHLAQRLAQRSSIQPTCGPRRTRPSVARTMPDTAAPLPT
jgi:hypothetical protein